MASNETAVDPPAEGSVDLSATEKETNNTNHSEESSQPECPEVAAPGSSSKDGDASEEAEPKPKESTGEQVKFKVIFSKQKFDITFGLDETVEEFKKHLATITHVPYTMQKLMYKGKLNDESTLRESKITSGAKVMLIGSTVTDVLTVAAPDMKALKAEIAKDEAASKEPLCKQKPHKTVLEKHGKPDDAMIGVRNKKESLPPCPIAGMYNKSGGKVRLTFKLEQDQLWIGTKERTEKVPMGSIKAVVSEPIEGHEEYHMMGFQLGPTEASRYWVYWVPAQYVDSIKDSVLGKWQFF